MFLGGDDLAEVVVVQRPLQSGAEDILLRQGRAEGNVRRALSRLPHRAGLLGAEQNSESAADNRFGGGSGAVAETEPGSEIEAAIGIIWTVDIANLSYVKVVVEQSVRIVDTASFAAALLRVRRQVRIVVVTQSDIQHQVLGDAVVVLGEDSQVGRESPNTGHFRRKH